MTEERESLDGIPGVAPKDFTFFESAKNNTDVKRACTIMQIQYVLRDEDRINYEKAIDALASIYQFLSKKPSWTNYKI